MEDGGVGYLGTNGPLPRLKHKLTHLMLDGVLHPEITRLKGGAEAVNRLLATILWDSQLQAISLTGSKGLPTSSIHPVLALASLRPRAFKLRELICVPSSSLAAGITRKEAFMRACCHSYYQSLPPKTEQKPDEVTGVTPSQLCLRRFKECPAASSSPATSSLDSVLFEGSPQLKDLEHLYALWI